MLRRLSPPSRLEADLGVAAAVMIWIAAVLVVDAAPLPNAGQVFDGGLETLRQVALGLSTWAVLVAVLRREEPLVRVQTGVVVALATLVEYTFSPLLEAYVYRIGTVPLFVPPGHGLVYLAALALGRSALVRAAGGRAVVAVLAIGSVWTVLGLLGPLGLPEVLGPGGDGRHDVLGAFWFACLVGFLLWGPNRALYVGAFVVVSLLEIMGTALGTWTWAPVDPVLGVIGQGNPPSGAAGGYGWFDLYALLLAPRLLAAFRRTGLPAPGRAARRWWPARSRRRARPARPAR